MNMQIRNLYFNTCALEARDEYHQRNLFIATESDICSDGCFLVCAFNIELQLHSSHYLQKPDANHLWAVSSKYRTKKL